MSLTRPFEVGEKVTVWKSGEVESRNTVIFSEGAVVGIDNGLYFVNGEGVSREAKGRRIAHQEAFEVDLIRRKAAAARVMEIINWLAFGNRLQKLNEGELNTLEKLMLPSVAAILRRYDKSDQLHAFIARLKEAERFVGSEVDG